jgi:hypothetical protein
MVGARLKSLFEEQAKKRQQAGGANGGSVKPLNNQSDKVEAQVPQPSRDPQSRDLAGDSVNVGAKVIDRADKVIKQGAPELVHAVEQGKIAVSTASGSLSAWRSRRNSRRWVSAGFGLKRRVRILVAKFCDELFDRQRNPRDRR